MTQYRAYSDTLAAVQRRLEHLPARIHGDDPRTLYSRILAGYGRTPTHGDALHLAALSVALVAAIDRAEMARVDTGGPE